VSQVSDRDHENQWGFAFVRSITIEGRGSRGWAQKGGGRDGSKKLLKRRDPPCAAPNLAEDKRKGEQQNP